MPEILLKSLPKIIIMLFLLFQCYPKLKTVERPNFSFESSSHTELPPNAIPGNCYAKLTYPDNRLDWHTVICSGQNKKIKSAKACLQKLGYLVSNQSYWGKIDRASIIEFQKKNQLPYGELTEETLNLLIQQTKNLQIK